MAENAAEEALDGMDRLRKMIEVLVPDTSVITDLKGNSYNLPFAVQEKDGVKTVKVSMAARRQIAAMKAVEAILLAAEDAGFSFSANDNANLFKAAVHMISDEAVASKVDDAFAKAYPEVIKAASGGDAALGALDLFDLDEVIRALSPLAASFAEKAVSVIQTIAKTVKDPTTP